MPKGIAQSTYYQAGQQEAGDNFLIIVHGDEFIPITKKSPVVVVVVGPHTTDNVT